MGLYYAVVLASWMVTKLPRGLCLRMADIVGDCAFAVARRARSAILANLSVVMGESASSSVVRSTARQVFRTNTRNWVDSLRLSGTTTEQVRSRVRVEHWDTLIDALNQGRGVIVIGAHVGNVDTVGQIVAANGIDVTIPVEEMKPKALFERTQRLRQSFGIHTVPAHNSARKLLRALKSGGVIGIMADRNLESEGIEVQFFGRPAIVSRGPAWLATYCDAPVLCGIGTRNRDGTFSGLVTEIPVRRTQDREADIRANAQAIISAVEERIRRNPEQWCMFARVWPDSPRLVQ